MLGASSSQIKRTNWRRSVWLYNGSLALMGQSRQGSMDFKLVSDYEPRGDQVAAIEQLIRGVEAGEPGVRDHGICSRMGSSSTSTFRWL